MKLIWTEEVSLMPRLLTPRIDRAICTGCGDCVIACPASAVDMTDRGPQVARPNDCTYCTECEAICPVGAISCPFEIRWEGT
jgi:ferredoxin